MANNNEPPADPALLGEWVRNRLRKAAPIAVRSIIELAEMADSEQTRLQASKDLLGLVGVTQKQQVEVDHGLKKSQEEVDHALREMQKRLEAGKQPLGLPPGKELEIVVEKDEGVPVEKPDSEEENG